MRRSLLLSALLAAVTMGLSSPARAQYMYLDSNGDGVHTAADLISPNGVPTNVDVWIRTNVNRDGSPGVCPTGDGELTISSYVVNIGTLGGTVQFSNFVNRRAEMSITLQPFNSSTTEMVAGYGGVTRNPPGDYLIFSFTVTALSGSPSVAITPTSGLQSVDYTSFGSLCSGNDFDNTMKLGSDWFDVDGLGPAVLQNNPPAITAPATVSGITGASLSLTASASDPDAENVTLAQTNNAPFFPSSSSSGPALNPSLTLTGTPGSGQAGSYSINWSAADSHVPAGTAAATTVLTIGPGGDTPPVITSPSTAAGTENSPITVTAAATDVDGNPLVLSQTNNAPFFPPSSSVGPVVNPVLSVTGTPNFNQAGFYMINWTASDGLGGVAAATTNLSIANLNRAPVIAAPATVLFQTFVAVTITGSAADPDGQNVTLSQTNNAPFLAGPASAGPSLNPSITLTGTPGFTDDGVYTINWSAVDSNVPAGTATATTSLHGSGPNRAPVILAPLSVSGTEGVPISITASASDPDGQIVTLCVAGSTGFLVGGPCAPPSLNPSLTLSGTPGNNDAGIYTITWTATDGSGGSSAATTLLTIADSNHAPMLAQPADMTVDEGATATQQLTASDADNDPLTFSKVGTSPLFMSVSSAGLVTLTPGYADQGSYTATVAVSDGSLSDQKSFAIMVSQINRCPTANAGGPYSGVLFAAVNFDGTGSSDPDGDALSYAWDFGDGATGSGATTSHTYTGIGTYPVTLTVNDGACPGSATTTVAIADGYSANAFTVGGNKTTSLNSGKPFTCVEIEPVGGSFDIANVNLATVKMLSMGTGSVSEISADAGKTSLAGDKNGNGVAEIEACFAKADLRLLFSTLPAGTNQVDVTITGSLTTGGIFIAHLTLTVKATGGALAASLAPNPLNPSAVLDFSTSKPGAVKVELYDLNGRLVRRYLDERQAAAGHHDVTIDGRAALGARLASGVYFVKIWTEHDGSETKSLTILK